MNALSRTAKGALIAAHQRGSKRMVLTLLNSERFSFIVEEVMDDAIIGQRAGSVGSVTLIPMASILFIEITP